ncbi:hypothetical protein LguiB_005684 [Lonicera macranthoides]
MKILNNELGGSFGNLNNEIEGSCEKDNEANIELDLDKDCGSSSMIYNPQV